MKNSTPLHPLWPELWMGHTPPHPSPPVNPSLQFYKFSSSISLPRSSSESSSRLPLSLDSCGKFVHPTHWHISSHWLFAFLQEYLKVEQPVRFTFTVAIFEQHIRITFLCHPYHINISFFINLPSMISW